jgi:RNA polymerase sigma factor (sigma-70 family)
LLCFAVRCASRAARDSQYLSVHTSMMDGSSPPSPESLFRHYPFLRRVARQHLVASAADLEADDVVQDVVLRVLRRWPHLRFSDERALAGYLHRAVVNRARDARRVAPRRAGIDLDVLRSPRPTALDGLLSNEWRRRAAQALRHLRAGDRRVVLGRVVASLSFGELAARTGHPSADAARKATTRALGRLRQRLMD